MYVWNESLILRPSGETGSCSHCALFADLQRLRPRRGRCDLGVDGGVRRLPYTCFSLFTLLAVLADIQCAEQRVQRTRIMMGDNVGADGCRLLRSCNLRVQSIFRLLFSQRCDRLQLSRMGKPGSRCRRACSSWRSYTQFARL